MGYGFRSSFEQLDFSSPSPYQPFQNFSTSQAPLGQFLRSDSIWLLAPVQPRHQRRSLDVSTAYIKGPRRECSELIRIQLDCVFDVIRDTFREGLDIGLEEFSGVRFGEWEFVGNFGTTFRLAKVAESHCRKTYWIGRWTLDESLKLLDQ